MKAFTPFVWVPVSALSLALAGHYSGLAGAFLIGAALTLALVIALVWASLDQLASGGEMSFHDAYHLAAPTPAEEQKRAVLRALKDLEYEKAVGKISPEDYEQLSRHYRDEAKRFIALADESLAEGRKLAELALAHELERRGAAGQVDVKQVDVKPGDVKQADVKPGDVKPAESNQNESTSSSGAEDA
ncbi:MAG TPA: hypothetical protein VLC09_06295 [Polyangiaceae bacterium]|nr:hypothetical protein [Polyangiaceae bacterium]